MEFIKEHFIELSALGISLIALTISGINFWLNRARVVVLINRFQEIRDVPPPSEEAVSQGWTPDLDEIIEFRIVNRGRRPIKIKHLSGEFENGAILRIENINKKLNEFEDFSYSDVTAAIYRDYKHGDLVRIFFEDVLGRRYEHDIKIRKFPVSWFFSK